MQIILPLFPGADGMTYTNAPTWAGVTVPRWYASVTSHVSTPLQYLATKILPGVPPYFPIF